MNKRQIGSQYEERVCRYLEGHGYQILEKNYRVKPGEIDIIAKDGAYYVFIEVKYRKTDKLGHPKESISKAKQRTISKVALWYMTSKKLSIYDTPVRFDVAAILDDKLEYIQNAFFFMA